MNLIDSLIAKAKRPADQRTTRIPVAVCAT